MPHSMRWASDRATSVIGRAIRLTLINLMDVRPGGIDRTTLGHPGKFSYCLAEDEEGTNWQPLSIVRGLSAVTVMAALAPRQIMNEWSTDPKEILETFAAEMRANQRHYSIYGGNYAIVIPKQLRDHIEAAGWTKHDIAEFLFERARIRRKEWADVGKVGNRARSPRKNSHRTRIARPSFSGSCWRTRRRIWCRHSALDGYKTKAVTAAIGACVDCEPPKA
ncbi:MAG: hypothetical protein WAO13_20280 [Pseudolabrys sp.]